MLRSKPWTTLTVLLFMLLLAALSSSTSLAAAQQELLLLTNDTAASTPSLPWGIDLDAYAVPQQQESLDASVTYSDSTAGAAPSEAPAVPGEHAQGYWGINLSQYHIPRMTFEPEVLAAEAEPEPEAVPEPTHAEAPAAPPAPPVETPPAPTAPAEAAAPPADTPPSPPIQVAGGNNAAPGQEVAYAPAPNAMEAPTSIPDTSSLEQEIVLDENGLKALEQFHTFAASRLQRIASNLRASEDNVEVEDLGTMFVARYMRINASTLSLQVKPVDYDHTPFVGVMRYQREIYEATGNTAEEAMAGNYEMVRDTKITEIFRYTRDAWEE